MTEENPNMIIIEPPESLILAAKIAREKGTTRAEIKEYCDALMRDVKKAELRRHARLQRLNK